VPDAEPLGAPLADGEPVAEALAHGEADVERVAAGEVVAPLALGSGVTVGPTPVADGEIDALAAREPEPHELAEREPAAPVCDAPRLGGAEPLALADAGREALALPLGDGVPLGEPLALGAPALALTVGEPSAVLLALALADAVRVTLLELLGAGEPLPEREPRSDTERLALGEWLVRADAELLGVALALARELGV